MIRSSSRNKLESSQGNTDNRGVGTNSSEKKIANYFHGLVNNNTNSYDYAKIDHYLNELAAKGIAEPKDIKPNSLQFTNSLLKVSSGRDAQTRYETDTKTFHHIIPLKNLLETFNRALGLISPPNSCLRQLQTYFVAILIDQFEKLILAAKTTTSTNKLLKIKAKSLSCFESGLEGLSLIREQLEQTEQSKEFTLVKEHAEALIDTLGYWISNGVIGEIDTPADPGGKFDNLAKAFMAPAQYKAAQKVMLLSTLATKAIANEDMLELLKNLIILSKYQAPAYDAKLWQKFKGQYLLQIEDNVFCSRENLGSPESPYLKLGIKNITEIAKGMTVNEICSLYLQLLNYLGGFSTPYAYENASSFNTELLNQFERRLKQWRNTFFLAKVKVIDLLQNKNIINLSLINGNDFNKDQILEIIAKIETSMQGEISITNQAGLEVIIEQGKSNLNNLIACFTSLIDKKNPPNNSDFTELCQFGQFINGLVTDQNYQEVSQKILKLLGPDHENHEKITHQVLSKCLDPEFRRNIISVSNSKLEIKQPLSYRP